MSDEKSRTSLVSVIIPCYNSEDYVEKAIESALSQTYEQAEVVVIDDGSTDDSLDVIRSYNDQILWRTGENQGAPAARNWGLRLSSGKYIKFVDADDLLTPEILEKQVSVLQSLDVNQIVYGPWGAMNEEGGDRRRSTHKPRVEGEHPVCFWLRSNAQTMAPMHRRKALREIGGFNERLPRAQEYDLHLRLALRGYRFEFLDEVVGYTRQHEGGSRIGNQNHFVNDPERRLDRIRERFSMIRSIDEEVPSCAFKILARKAWKNGRKSLRKEFPCVAERYFELARRISPCEYMKGSFAYRILSMTFGPKTTEFLLTKL